MNFGKILNIFIVLFLIVNILLFGIYGYKNKMNYSIKGEKEKLLIEVLNNNNVYVYCLLPEFHPKKRLRIEIKKVEEEKLKKSMFGNSETVYKRLPLELSYTKDNEKLVIYKGGAKKGEIYYINTDVMDEEDFDISFIQKLSKKLMNKLTIKENMILTSTQHDDYNKYYQLEYNDKFKGQTIFSSYANFRFYKNGIVEGEVTNQYKPTKFVGHKKELYPIDEVLYKFMDNIRKKDNNELIKIKGIDIGYYIDEEDISNKDIFDIEPCYRIRLGNNEVYYINAYTNKNISHNNTAHYFDNKK
jgi:regulatory protein YycI of two-component signal transduction system YycFG